MPALFPIFAILSLLLFILLHQATATRPPRKLKSSSYRNRSPKPTTSSRDNIWNALIASIKISWTITLIALNVHKRKLEAQGEVIDAAEKKADNKSSVVEVFELAISKEIVRISLAYIVLIVINWFSSTPISWLIVTLPTVPIAAFVCIRLLTSYRIQNEYYGNNPYEALEIIKFIEKNANNSDFPGGPGNKVLLSHKARKTRSFDRLGRMEDTV